MVRAAGYSIRGFSIVVYHYTGEYEALVIDPETDTTIVSAHYTSYPTREELERLVQKALEKRRVNCDGCVGWHI